MPTWFLRTPVFKLVWQVLNSLLSPKSGLFKNVTTFEHSGLILFLDL